MLSLKIIEDIALAHNFARSAVMRELKENYSFQNIADNRETILSLTYDETVRPGHRLDKALEYFRMAERNNYRIASNSRNTVTQTDGIHLAKDFASLRPSIAQVVPTWRHLLMLLGKTFISGNNFENPAAYNSVVYVLFQSRNSQGQRMNTALVPYRESCFFIYLDGILTAFQNYTYRDLIKRITRSTLAEGRTTLNLRIDGDSIYYRDTPLSCLIVHAGSFKSSTDQYTLFFSQVTAEAFSGAQLQVTPGTNFVEYYCPNVGTFVDRLEIPPPDREFLDAFADSDGEEEDETELRDSIVR